MIKPNKKDILELENRLRDDFNFKKKWLDDKSGYWFEKYFKCRFFSVKFTFHTEEPWYNHLTIELINGKDECGYERFLPIFNKKITNFEQFKELHSYWKKQSTGKVNRTTNVRISHDKSRSKKR